MSSPRNSVLSTLFEIDAKPPGRVEVGFSSAFDKVLDSWLVRSPPVPHEDVTRTQLTPH